MFSKRILNLTPSKTTMSAQVASELKQQQKDVISLGLGEPDFNTPEYILDAVKEAMYAGKGHHYTPSTGILPLREAISDFHAKHDGVKYQTDEIFVADGAKMALYFLCQVLVEHGDEVLIPSPYWVSYLQQVKLAEATPVIVETNAANEFKVTVDLLEQYTTERTKVLILNTPSNPTGLTYSATELQEIGAYCVAHNILIIADEMYYRLIYDNFETISMISLSEEIRKNTIIVNGFSKAYAMTGWRLGYVLADKEIIKQLAKLSSQTNSNVTGLTQYAGIAALEGSQADFEKMRTTFSHRLDKAYQQINELPGFKLAHKPKGAFYLFPDISETCRLTGFETVDAFADALLAEEYVLVIPGSAFGQPNHVRLSYALDTERFAEAMRRVAHFIEKHQMQ